MAERDIECILLTSKIRLFFWSSGGDKSSQACDIKKADKILQDLKEAHEW